MPLHTRGAREKLAKWKENKEKIANLIAQGWDIKHVEEEMQRSGCRITAQVRECIWWEKGVTEVRKLLDQGLEVAAIEEKMRLKGWIWTDNIKKKAFWEYHREEIIGLYRSHRSVEAVREIMARKGFMPKTRIYYEWLNRWGISTKIDRSNTTEIDSSSPSRSTNQDTPNSASTPCNHVRSILSGSSSVDMRHRGVLESPDLSHQSSQGSVPDNRRVDYTINPILIEDEVASDGDDDSDEGGDVAEPDFTTTMDFLYSDDGTVDALENTPGYNEGLQSAVDQRNPWQMCRQNFSSRHRWGSSDSGVGFGTVNQFHPANSINPEPNGSEEAVYKSFLYKISCPMNHRATDINCHNCGSSFRQELAHLAGSMSPHRVYEYLCYCLQQEDMRASDYSGNTFLHKLAVIGASWAYFNAGINAHIDPCHRNAYGQTFAHVLDIFKFGNSLTECIVSLLEHGIDFGLRDSSGRTVLHCIYGQPMTQEAARQILERLNNPGRLLCLRDVSGQTPYDLLKHNLLQQAPANYRWSMELQQQIVSSFEHFVNSGVQRLRYESTDRPIIAEAVLQAQYREVIDKAIEGIVVEAIDGSNAFHAQAALTTIHDGPVDLCRLKRFITIGVDVNSYDNYGRTPLEAIITLPRDWETELTTSEKVSLLIDEGNASVDSRNRLGHTPLYSAAIRGLDRTVEVLLRRGAHVNIRDNEGKSLLEAVREANEYAFGEFSATSYCRYHEAQVSRIAECKVLLERHGAVREPLPAQAMGYAPKPPVLQ